MNLTTHPALILTALVVIPGIFAGIVINLLHENRESPQQSDRILGRAAQTISVLGIIGCLCIALLLPLSWFGLVPRVPESALVACTAALAAAFHLLVFLKLRLQLRQKKGASTPSMRSPDSSVAW